MNKGITAKELSLVEDNSLNELQLKMLLKRTPKAYVYERPAKGGGTWKYVTGTYVRKVLNMMFGFDWDFEVVEYKYDLDIKQVFVLGKLTCRSNGKTIIKQQFGTKDIMCKRADGKPLDLGNDLKAATTNALKKCASELGIASDIYAPKEFKEVTVIKEQPTTQQDKDYLTVRARLKKFGLKSNGVEGLNLFWDSVPQIERIDHAELYNELLKIKTDEV